MVALGMPSAHDHWSSNFRLTSTTFPQIGRAVEGFLDRVARHCSENHADPDDFVHARLFEMARFGFVR